MHQLPDGTPCVVKCLHSQRKPPISGLKRQVLVAANLSAFENGFVTGGNGGCIGSVDLGFVGLVDVHCVPM